MTKEGRSTWRPSFPLGCGLGQAAGTRTVSMMWTVALAV